MMAKTRTAAKQRVAALKASGDYGYTPKAEQKKAQYEEVALVRSRKDPTKKYMIKRLLTPRADAKVGDLSCPCGAWVFKREIDALGRRTCPHLKIYWNTPDEAEI